MQAVILVGGFGTRLRPLTYGTPKQMLPVGNRPMIELVVSHLGKQGITEVILSLGYQPDKFTDAYPDNTISGVPVRYAVEPEPLDTAGAIGFAARQLGVADTFVALNGDVINDLDVKKLVELHKSCGGEGTIHLTPVDDPSRYGVVPIDENNLVEAFIEKPDPGTAPSNWINGGTYVLEPTVLDRIPEGKRCSIEREVFPEMVASSALYAMEAEGYWVDAGTPQTYLQIGLDLINGVRASEQAIDPSAQVDSSATVSGSIVGSGCIVGEGAVVTDSMLHPGVVVEAGATISGSIIAPNAIVGSRASLRELCVIGSGEKVEAETELVGVKQPDPATVS